jgi:hypothetical protein
MKRRKRTLSIGVIASLALSVIANGSVANAAAKTTKTTKTVSGTGERLKPDYKGLPVDVLIRRAAKARGARDLTASVVFSTITPQAEDSLPFKGTVDFARRQGNFDFVIDDVKQNYLFVDETGYLKVEKDKVAVLGGSWVKSVFTDQPTPTALYLLEVLFATPGVVGTVTTWKDLSTKADKAAGIRRLSGSGSVPDFLLLDRDRFDVKVPVEVVFEGTQAMKSIRWNLKPIADVSNLSVKFVGNFGSPRTLVVTAPTKDVVDYADAAAASIDAAESSDAAAAA